MAALANRVQNALDEARILVLGAQIFIGFEYRAFFEPEFPSLPWWARLAKLGALCLTLVAFALMVLPTPYHRLVEGGEDTLRLHRFTTRAVAAALLPLGLGLGLEVRVAASLVELGDGPALAAAVAATALALGLWYALPAAGRKPRAQENEMARTSMDEKIRHVLTEARMVLPGAQALLAFQLSVTMMQGFRELPRGAKLLHFGDIMLTALAVVLLITPAAYHRIAEGGENTASFHALAGAFVLGAMIPLALALSGDLALVAYQVFGRPGPAALFGAGSLALFLATWFGVALGARLRRRSRQAQAHA